MSELGDTPNRAPGWCEKHNDFAWRYDDGSISCFYLCIIESGSDDCVWSARELVVPSPQPAAAIDAIRSIMSECEGRRFGESGYDITYDHIYDCAEVALAAVSPLPETEQTSHE